MAKMTRLAVIDLGSNSVRLKISELLPDNEAVTKQYVKRYVRLSSQMGPEKTLKKEPVERTLDALREFRTICDQYSRLKVIAVATAAVRQAQNQAEFLQRAKKETGFDIQVISGAQEAYLDYVGVTHSLEIDRGLIIDTGGCQHGAGRCGKRGGRRNHQYPAGFGDFVPTLPPRRSNSGCQPF